MYERIIPSVRGITKVWIFKDNIRAVSVECRKTKTKVIALAIHKEHAQYSEPIKSTRSNYS